MRATAQYQAEVLRRIREFLQRQPVTIAVGDIKETMLLLDAAIAALERHGSTSEHRRRASIAATGRIHDLARTARREYLLPLARAAAHLFPNDGQLRASLRLPAQLPPRIVVDTLLGMAEAAAPHKASLAKAGFADDFVQRMQNMAEALKTAIDDRSRETAQRAAANAGKKLARRDARSLMRLLDAFVAPRLAGTPLLSEWTSLLRQGITRPQNAESEEDVTTDDTSGATTVDAPQVAKAA